MGVERPRVLWLTGEQRPGADVGGAVYSNGLRASLAAAGAEVVAVGLADPGEPDAPDPGTTWRAVADPPRPKLRSLTGPWPSMVSALATPGYRQALELALREGWDAVVVDHLRMGWVLDALDRGASRPLVVYASQNHEASVRTAVAAEAPVTTPNGVVLRLEAAKARRLEARLVQRADLVTCVSEEDAVRFAADGTRRPPLVLTPGYAGTRVAARTITAAVPRRVVVVSNLNWHVKQRNLRALLAAADGPLHAAGAEVVVVGPVPDEFRAAVEPGLRATRLLGRVDRLADPLAEARLGVVYEPLGGGFKLKSLDYVFNRVPMATLDGSMAGMPLEAGTDYRQFPDAASLTSGLLDLLDDLKALNGLHTRAYDRCTAAFDWRSRGQDLLDAIQAA